MNQLFVVDAEAFRASTPAEIRATVAALREAGMYSLPFPTVDVRLPGDLVGRFVYSPDPHILEGIRRGQLFRNGEFVYSNLGSGYWIEFQDISLEHFRYKKFSVMDGSVPGFRKSRLFVDPLVDGSQYAPVEKERDACADLLIVLLATRNAIKTTVHRKSVGLGIGKNKHEYTTTISVPREMDVDPDHVPKGGGTRCPHLRRGHNRRQHYGPRNALVRTQWIAPVFVNADKEWTRTRTAYNVSL